MLNVFPYFWKVLDLWITWPESRIVKRGYKIWDISFKVNSEISFELPTQNRYNYQRNTFPACKVQMLLVQNKRL